MLKNKRKESIIPMKVKESQKQIINLIKQMKQSILNRNTEIIKKY